MNFFKTASILPIIGAFMALSSCDSDGPDPVSDTDVAESLELPAEGDVLQLTSTDLNTNYNPFVFTGGLATDTISNLGFNYSRAGTFGFSLVPQGIDGVSATQIFNDVVNNLLGVNTSLGAEFRDIVNNTTVAPFTQNEISRLVTILNTSGANIIDNGDGTLSSFVPSNILFRVTSNVEDLVAGSQGGTYSLDGSTSPVVFASPSATQLGITRLLLPTAQIPFISDQINLTNNLDVGTWILRLNP